MKPVTKKSMKCPLCGAGHLVHDTRDVLHVYKGQSTMIPNVTGDHCLACGETLMDAENSGDFVASVTSFRMEVDASYVDPAYITEVRLKLGLSMQEAAEIFGGGVRAFIHVEEGRARLSLAQVKLLKMLDRHPGLLAEIKDT